MSSSFDDEISHHTVHPKQGYLLVTLRLHVLGKGKKRTKGVIGEVMMIRMWVNGYIKKNNDGYGRIKYGYGDESE